MTEVQHLLVSRRSLAETKLDTDTLPPLGEGEVLLKVDSFALTANNVTYGAMGDAMRYWNFFPAKDGWGRIPVWGFATVAESRAEGVTAGQRIYGYLPTSSHVVVKPEKVSASGFVDGAAHRSDLPGAYQAYQFAKAEKDADALAMVFRPLFGTSYLVDDLLADNGEYGARQVLISSASAKTAYIAARLMTQRGVDVVGLTSPANIDFVKGLGAYKAVLGYDAIETLDAGVPTAFVDIAGDAAVRARVHKHFRDALTLSLAVGATHWEQGRLGGGEALPGPATQFFFAPDQITKRTAEWGADVFGRRLAEAQSAFLDFARDKTRVVKSHGLSEAQRVLGAHVAGRVPAYEGHVIDLR